MGCCMSSDKTTVYEVVLDQNGVARRVPQGQGTHLIHVTEDKETHLEQKTEVVLPSATSTLPRPPDSAYHYPKSPKMAWNPPSKQRRSTVSPVMDEKLAG